MDDGTIARLSDERYYVTTTSTGADSVNEWFEWWNAIWGYDVEIQNVTGALAAVNLAGPRCARGARRAPNPTTSRTRAFAYLDAKQIGSPVSRTLVLRIGFVGELGYELHCPSPAGGAPLGRARRRGRGAVRSRAAARAPAREGARDRRAGHRLGVEPDSAGMSWIPKLDKDDWVGKLGTELRAEREANEQLVGFPMRRTCSRSRVLRS